MLEPPHGNTTEYLVEWTPSYCRHILQLLEQVSDVSSDGEAPATLLHFMEGLRNRSPLSCALCGNGDHTSPQQGLRLCVRCLCLSHTDCAQARAEALGVAKPTGPNISQWSCPGCPAKGRRCPLPGFVCLVSWEPFWMVGNVITSLHKGIKALETYNERYLTALWMKRRRLPAQGGASPVAERLAPSRRAPPLAGPAHLLPYDH